MMCANILLSSYNSHGLGADKISYMNQSLKHSDILFIQEHWLLESTIVKLERLVPGAHVHCVSGMIETEFKFGRPYGGVAILWKTNIKCKVTPVPLLSRRMCAVTIFINGVNIILFNCYMPCDTDYDRDNLDSFNAVLQEICETCIRLDAHFIIIGGDLNTDFRRLASLHTNALSSFLILENMTNGLQHLSSDVDYTFQSKISNGRSIIDHFILTENLFKMICEYKVMHDGDNLSDHRVIQMSLQIPVEYFNARPTSKSHVSKHTPWHKASSVQLQKYRDILDDLLDEVHIPIHCVNIHGNYWCH